jgi:diguanylate cyclase (GGDEF)-like protein/PAS domain S-box-containing protein
MEPKTHVPLSKVMDLLLDVVCVVDAAGCYLFVNAAFEHVFGYAPEEVIGRRMIELVYPPDLERTRQAVADIMSGQPMLHFENRYVRKDGQVVHVMWSARWSEADQARIAVGRDVTGLKRAEHLQAALFDISEAANTAEDLLALFRRIHEIIGELLPATNFFVCLYDDKKDELSFPYFIDEHDATPAPRKLDSGTLSAEVIRTGQTLLLTPDSDVALSEHVSTIVGRDSLDWLGVPLHAAKGVIGALVVQSYSGAVRYTSKDAALLQFVSSQIAAAIVRKQSEAWLQHIARHDPLTDLPNRTLIHDRLQVALDRARRERQRLALLYIDLDGFKRVNDSFGHTLGDLLLQEVAQRITRCVRASDTVGRIGGDEFVVLLHDIAQPADATAIADQIRAALDEPFNLAGQCLGISSSIGIATYPEHADDGKQLIRHADEAMYAAKKNGGNALLMASASAG